MYSIEKIIFFKDLFQFNISEILYKFGLSFFIAFDERNAPFAKISLDNASCLKDLILFSL